MQESIGKLVTPDPNYGFSFTLDAKDIPMQLSTKAGGPLAVKPISEPGKIAPQGQWFLVGVDFVEADGTIAINSHAQVKIHNEYRSLGWWAWRSLSSTFDIGLM